MPRTLKDLVTAPLRLWRRSLTLRVVGSTVLGSALVMLLSGVFLLQQASTGILDGKRQSALAEASVALDLAQRRLHAADTTSSTNDLLTQLTFEVANRGNLGGYQVIIQGQVADIRSGGILPESVPSSLRDRVSRATGTTLYITPTEIRYSDGREPEAGLAIGASLAAAGSARYPMYLLFPLTQEQATLEVMNRATLITGLFLIVLLGLISAIVSRQIVVPIKRAKQQAEAIASGEWDNRMPVRGEDDLASLVESMNNMGAELGNQITQLEELSRVQHRFVSDVSHELRTPLTTVRMASEMLYDSREEFGPTERRSAELMHDELERFEALLNDLLEISRFDAGAAQLSLEPADLRTVVRREMAAQGPFAERNGVELRLHGEDDCTAEMDVRRVTRIIRNLLSNAIEHGEGKPIDVILAADEKAVAVAVRDHGVGFEAAQVKQVFLRFWRADPARNRTVGGTGLGLSIAMEDARLHGGWLNAWGRPNQGAQFRLTLPRTAGSVLEMSPLPVVPRDLTEEVPCPNDEQPGAAVALPANGAEA
ncbi:MtrAB system histidine kinase MtrB [Granulicoccus phenolivorans]|uniref:MtrAB system histidine kinase MtrB n=1 Tax=Granulicoccus phenolivorans TaxID=266854 RepID=UPI0003F92FFE|nr:MtrAB system histidine kinase MtrB [Granulicoccus phenolivorans]